MSSFLVGTALAVLLALAITTVVVGVVTSLRIEDTPPPPPITRHGRWELRRLPDGSTEYAWIARQAGHFSPETNPAPDRRSRGRHRISPSR
ncbi:hypothetical protein PUR61_02340 [Streptomyces sp. BE20]|uniref:hypothetical protein n=1 Tax=Streptomyces sp. BE20 TaxID=3002525 RepID=UPI002E7717B7|nr:hypothetical protein [Streptomyces sp. BE20]MEE1821044.1 hypothetical protein [Streptomyces sp. BE20]